MASAADLKKTGTLNMRIDPKLKFLAELAAEEDGHTLTEFIQRLIREKLTQDVDSSGVRVLRNEGLWNQDECDRFFTLASQRADLLTLAEQRFWKLFNLTIPVGKHIRNSDLLKMFRSFWNSPEIDTNHLKAESK